MSTEWLVASVIVVAVAALSALAWKLGDVQFDWFSESEIAVDIDLVKAGRIFASDGDREFVFRMPPHLPDRYEIRDGDGVTLIGRRRMKRFVISRVRLDNGSEFPVAGA